MYSPINEPDVEWGGAAGGKSIREPTFAFAEQVVRRGFIRKVLGLLSLQLIITAAVATAMVTVPSVKAAVAGNPFILIAALIASFVLILVLACSESARRSHPTNLILMFMFTACQSARRSHPTNSILMFMFTACQALLVGSACASYSATVVAMAFVITAVVVTGLVMFTLQTKYDLTSMHGMLYSLLLALLVASVMFFRAPWLHVLICAGGAALFSLYLIFDLQLIMGNSELSLGPDEYVLATLNLYLDIINLFLYILQLVGSFTKDNQS
ncbi:hypothetical protein FOA52_012438 [Chlamydomonas sp. UWO 241]|nr:hypothetical protein FOA52_012438 [Chlamydomonas sp. UWO 241]